MIYRLRFFIAPVLPVCSKMLDLSRPISTRRITTDDVEYCKKCIKKWVR